MLAVFVQFVCKFFSKLRRKLDKTNEKTGIFFL